MLLKQKFLGLFKYSLPSKTGKGAVHIVNQLSRIALLKQWPAVVSWRAPVRKAVTFAAFGTLTCLRSYCSPLQENSESAHSNLILWTRGHQVGSSQPTVTGKCPSSPPRHEHFSNSLLPLYATYGQTFSHPPSHLLQFFCCLEVGPGALKVWNECVEKEKLLIKLFSLRLSLIHIKVDKQAGYY